MRFLFQDDRVLSLRLGQCRQAQGERSGRSHKPEREPAPNPLRGYEHDKYDKEPGPDALPASLGGDIIGEDLGEAQHEREEQAGCGDDDPGPDLAPPAIERTEPAADATGVSRTTQVKVFFDEALDNTRIGWDDQLHLVRPDGANLYGNGSYDLAAHVATLTMAIELEAGATYQVVLERGICDLNNNCTTEASQWSFRVAP